MKEFRLLMIWDCFIHCRSGDEEMRQVSNDEGGPHSVAEICISITRFPGIHQAAAAVAPTEKNNNRNDWVSERFE